MAGGHASCVAERLRLHHAGLGSSPPPLTRTGHLNILLHWIECIPPALVMQHPRLILDGRLGGLRPDHDGDVGRWIGALGYRIRVGFRGEVKLLKLFWPCIGTTPSKFSRSYSRSATRRSANNSSSTRESA